MPSYDYVKYKYDEARRKWESVQSLLSRPGASDWQEIWIEKGEQLDSIRDAYIATGRERFNEFLAAKSDEVVQRIARIDASVQQMKDHLTRMATRASTPPPATPPPAPARFGAVETGRYDFSKDSRISLYGRKKEAFDRLIRGNRGSLSAAEGQILRMNRELSRSGEEYDGLDAAGWNSVLYQVNNLQRLAREAQQKGQFPYWDDFPLGL